MANAKMWNLLPFINVVIIVGCNVCAYNSKHFLLSKIIVLEFLYRCLETKREKKHSSKNVLFKSFSFCWKFSNCKSVSTMCCKFKAWRTRIILAPVNRKHYCQKKYFQSKETESCNNNISQTISIWCLAMAFPNECTPKYSIYSVAAHEFSNDFAPLLSRLPFVFWSSSNISFVISLRTQTRLFSIFTVVLMCGCVRRVFLCFGTTCENFNFKHVLRYDGTLFEYHAYIDTASNSKEMGVSNWQHQKMLGIYTYWPECTLFTRTFRSNRPDHSPINRHNELWLGAIEHVCVDIRRNKFRSSHESIHVKICLNLTHNMKSMTWQRIY